MARRKTENQTKNLTKKKNHRYKRSDINSTKRKNLFMAGGFVVVLIILAVTATIPFWVVGWYAIINVVTFLVYAKDKQAAKARQWRVPEKSLHLLAVAGGWVGAMLGQTYLRHKTKKAEFRVVYYLTVLINLVGLIAVMLGHNPIELLNRLM